MQRIFSGEFRCVCPGVPSQLKNCSQTITIHRKFTINVTISTLTAHCNGLVPLKVETSQAQNEYSLAAIKLI